MYFAFCGSQARDAAAALNVAVLSRAWNSIFVFVVSNDSSRPLLGLQQPLLWQPPTASRDSPRMRQKGTFNGPANPGPCCFPEFPGHAESGPLHDGKILTPPPGDGYAQLDGPNRSIRTGLFRDCCLEKCIVGTPDHHGHCTSKALQQTNRDLLFALFSVLLSCRQAWTSECFDQHQCVRTS